MNLALACVSCSLRKGARRLAADPVSGIAVPIFHPRTQTWAEHFVWAGVRVRGLTTTGRATIALLQLNRASVLAIRREEIHHHRHPPR